MGATVHSMHTFIARQIRSLGNPSRREQGGNPALLLSAIVGVTGGVLTRTVGKGTIGGSVAAGLAIFGSTWAVATIGRIRESSDAWYECETYYGLRPTVPVGY